MIQALIYPIEAAFINLNGFSYLKFLLFPGPFSHLSVHPRGKDGSWISHPGRDIPFVLDPVIYYNDQWASIIFRKLSETESFFSLVRSLSSQPLSYTSNLIKLKPLRVSFRYLIEN